MLCRYPDRQFAPSEQCTIHGKIWVGTVRHYLIVSSELQENFLRSRSREWTHGLATFRWRSDCIYAPSEMANSCCAQPSTTRCSSCLRYLFPKLHGEC